MMNAWNIRALAEHPRLAAESCGSTCGDEGRFVAPNGLRLTAEFSAEIASATVKTDQFSGTAARFCRVEIRAAPWHNPSAGKQWAPKQEETPP
jgi:hypothetical protein